MQITTMRPDDLALALDWAADEGWNPGLGDAMAFRAADPGGFLIGRVAGEPIACISIVRHAPDFAFLGLYICRPAWRGRGHGLALWQAAMALAGARTVGLDGVPAQQANYARSGFVAAGRTTRYLGTLPGTPPDGMTPAARLVPAAAALDRAASGVTRAAFLAAWLADTPTRRSLALLEAGGLMGFGTVRRCREGLKVGPLLARSPAAAERLLHALAGLFPDRPLALDVPESATDALDLVQSFGMRPAFETARMYRGAPPAPAPGLTWGVATLELG